VAREEEEREMSANYTEDVATDADLQARALPLLGVGK